VPLPPAPELKLPPELHLQVETPMIYRGDASAPGPVLSASRLTTDAAGQPSASAPPPAPAAAPAKAEAPADPGKLPPKRHGLIRRFFSKLFG